MDKTSSIYSYKIATNINIEYFINWSRHLWLQFYIPRSSCMRSSLISLVSCMMMQENEVPESAFSMQRLMWVKWLHRIHRFYSFYLQTPPRQVSASSCFFVNPFNVYYIRLKRHWSISNEERGRGSGWGEGEVLGRQLKTGYNRRRAKPRKTFVLARFGAATKSKVAYKSMSKKRTRLFK